MTDGSTDRSATDDLRLLLTDPRARSRTLQLLAVLVAWAVVFCYLVAPALGFAPGLAGDDDDGITTTRDLPDTPKGWAMAGLGTPVVLGFVVLRARIAGEPPADYWALRPSDDE